MASLLIAPGGACVLRCVPTQALRDGAGKYGRTCSMWACTLPHGAEIALTRFDVIVSDLRRPQDLRTLGHNRRGQRTRACTFRGKARWLVTCPL